MNVELILLQNNGKPFRVVECYFALGKALWDSWCQQSVSGAFSAEPCDVCQNSVQPSWTLWNMVNFFF